MWSEMHSAKTSQYEIDAKARALGTLHSCINDVVLNVQSEQGGDIRVCRGQLEQLAIRRTDITIDERIHVNGGLGGVTFSFCDDDVTLLQIDDTGFMMKRMSKCDFRTLSKIDTL